MAWHALRSALSGGGDVVEGEEETGS